MKLWPANPLQSRVMRIGLFTSVFLPDVGGAELAADAVARQFQQRGHDITVIACGKKKPLDVPYPVRWTGKLIFKHWRPERVGYALLVEHQRQPFDVVLCNYTHPVGYAAVAARKKIATPFKIVIGSQGGDLYHSSKHRQQPHLWKRTVAALQQADALVAISPHMEALMREIAVTTPPIAHIPNGVDLTEISEPATRPQDFNLQRPFALCLGNIGPMKGFDHAIEAYGRCRDQLQAFDIVVVGDGPMLGQVRELANKLKLTDRVHFMGKRVGNDKRWFLQHCEFGIMPSIEEGLPLVALEFMANGKALIASTNPSFDRLIELGVNGWRVTPRDVDQIGQAMQTAWAADRSAMAAAAREKAKPFDWKNVAQQYLDLFEQLTNDSAHR